MSSVVVCAAKLFVHVTVKAAKELVSHEDLRS